MNAIATMLLVQQYIPVFWLHSLETELPVRVDRGGHVVRKNIEAPVWVVWRERPAHYELLVVALFEHQPPMWVAGCIPVGEHKGDIEHVTLRIEKVNGEPGNVTSVFFSSHIRSEGVWVPAHHIEFDRMRPVVYVALGNHAMYHHAGRHWRFFGFGNDLCDRGSRWTPRGVIADPLQPWMNERFQGEVDSLTSRRWFWTGERHAHISLRGHKINKVTRMFTHVERKLVYLLFLVCVVVAVQCFAIRTA